MGPQALEIDEIVPADSKGSELVGLVFPLVFLLELEPLLGLVDEVLRVFVGDVADFESQFLQGNEGVEDDILNELIESFNGALDAVIELKMSQRQINRTLPRLISFHELLVRQSNIINMSRKKIHISKL